MKGFMKIVLAGLVLLLVVVGGCVAIVGFGANEASKAISSEQQSDTKKSARFATRFKTVKVGDTLTGQGGDSKAEVAARLGKPHKSDITQTKSGGTTLVSWTWTFILSNGSSVYSVDFTNGHVSSKTKM